MISVRFHRQEKDTSMNTNIGHRRRNALASITSTACVIDHSAQAAIGNTGIPGADNVSGHPAVTGQQIAEVAMGATCAGGTGQ